MIGKFFIPPVFENEVDNHRAKFIHQFVWTGVVLLLIALFLYIANPSGDSSVYIFSGLIAVLLVANYLLRLGMVKASGMTIIILGWIGLGLQAFTADGIRDAILIAYIALGLFASVIIGWRTGGIVILSSIALIWGLAYLEANGSYVPELQDPVVYARDLSLIFIIITGFTYYYSTSLGSAIDRAYESEKKLFASNQSLMELNLSLENQIASRTSDLELANQRNEKRAKEFEAVAQISQATVVNESLDTLLPRLTALISDHFGFYHAGIFLLNEERSFAILRASNSEGGKRMLSRGHKLQVGQTGIVGFVAAVGKPRLALDVGDDAIYFDNPDLPNTRSEMALPLRLADEVIGVLDVQSKVSNAFEKEDIEILSTLADQVAIAIQNSRTYGKMQELLSKAQKSSSAYLEDAWQILQSSQLSVGVHVAGDDINKLTRPLTSIFVKRALKDGRTIVENGNEASLTIPIRLRDEVIGVMDIRTQNEHEWDEDEVDIAEAVADRLSLGLESSLLLKSTQRRAEIERITADISGKIGSTTQFDSIVRTAAEELSRVLGGSEVLVQIQPNALENSTNISLPQVPDNPKKVGK